MSVVLTYPPHELIVTLVGADPKPHEGATFAPSNRPEVQADIDGPNGTLLGKTQRWMKRISTKQSKFLLAQILDFLRQQFIAFPEIRVSGRD